MLRCGLLGKTLGHSYSPAIHAMLADYEYVLYEKNEAELEDFLRNGNWDGLNVTIPYKKAVIPFCDELSPLAANVGSVNTIVRKRDGRLLGDNTDVYGFLGMLRHAGIDAKGGKTLVLGSGGASVAVTAALRSLGTEPLIISRSGENNYQNLGRHRDAALIVNATPLGMYPHNGEAPVDLCAFPCCQGVLDLIYNPARSALLLQAEQRGIKHANGLYMLVAQAKRSSELFSGTRIEDQLVEEIERKLARDMENIVLIGMPGCGKSTLAAMLGETLGREVLDADVLLEARLGMPVPAYLSANAEADFREHERVVLAEIGRLSGKIIATGGGAVLREENYASLHQNGVIVWIRRALGQLPLAGRPLSQRGDLSAMYAEREPLYARFADHIVENDALPQTVVQCIMEVLS